MTSIQSYIARAVVANINNTSERLNSSILNLASGVKTNASVSDLAVGTMLRSQSSSLTTANLNAGQGKSLLQTAKGGLDEIVTLIQDLDALAVQATDSSLTANDRANLNTEAQTLIAEIDRLATTTNFNNKNLLDGTISGTATLTSKTGQATENYTLLEADPDDQISFSGTVASGELATSSTFDTVTSTNIGATAGSATLTFSTISGAVNNAVMTIGGGTVTFGDGTTASDTVAEVAGLFVAAARASTNADVRRFTYLDNGNGTVTVTGADLGTGADATTFEITTDSTITAATFGGASPSNVLTGPFSFATANNATEGTTRADPTAATIDPGLQGQLTNFTAALDTTKTYNEVTFTVDINGTTYTSQAVQLFGTGGFNSKGNTIKSAQVITFSDTSGPTDSSGNYTDNGFTLTVGSTDITISGATQTAFETDLTNTATGFGTQLTNNRINQSRDVVLAVDNDIGGDFDVASVSSNNTFAGIHSYDAIGTNTRGDIQFVGDQFGDEGRIGAIGNFSFTAATNKLSVSVNGEVFTADLSDNETTESANTTKGLVTGTGDGAYNSTTKVLTVDASTTTNQTTIIFHSAATNDGRQLRLILGDLSDKSIDLGTTAAAKVVTDDLDTLFGVGTNSDLSFQVGSGTTNTIDVALDSAKTTDIFLNDAGTSKTINISTVAGATEAQEVLDNALDNVLGIISTASSGITSFSSAITTNNVMIQNFDASSSALLDTNYALESTLFAQLTLQLSAGTSTLAAYDAKRTQSLLQLLQF